MNCYTVRLDENGQSVTNRIELPLRRSAQGARTWLGYPFVTEASEGRQNLGRHCTELTLEEKIITGNLLPRNRGNHEDRLSLRTCGFDREKVRITEPSREDSEAALVLVQASKIDVHFPPSRKQVGEGFLIEYHYVRFTRHPTRVVNRKVEERLFALAKGERAIFTIKEPEVRVFGIAVHKGRERTYAITNTGQGVTCEEVSSAPLAVPDFEQESLLKELSTGLLSLLFGTVLGAVAAPVGAGLVCGLIGLAAGLALFALVEFIRYIVARITVPIYKPAAPTSRGCCSSDI